MLNNDVVHHFAPCRLASTPTAASYGIETPRQLDCPWTTFIVVIPRFNTCAPQIGTLEVHILQHGIRAHKKALAVRLRVTKACPEAFRTNAPRITTESIASGNDKPRLTADVSLLLGFVQWIVGVSCADNGCVSRDSELLCHWEDATGWEQKLDLAVNLFAFYRLALATALGRALATR